MPPEAERRAAPRPSLILGRLGPEPRDAVTHEIPADRRDAACSDRSSPDHELRHLARRLQAYALPNAARSIAQLLVTAAALVMLWLGMWVSLGHGYWITLLLAVPAAGFLVRLFVLQHDCGHRSLFRSRLANDLTGRVLGVFTLTPYEYWRRAHAAHHASSGNLDRRGIGEITTLTVREYLGLSRWRRLVYWFYRHPLVLFGVGPPYLFVLKHRLPLDMPLLRSGAWRNLLATNLAIVGMMLTLSLLVGPMELLKLQLPIVLLAASAGVWLFYVQHQFEDSYWERNGRWSVHQAALQGSSYYSLPRLLQWLTASIGLHHIHHLCSRIPSYRLQECADENPELEQARRVTLGESLRCARLSLWDEEAGRMIRFRDLPSRTAHFALPALRAEPQVPVGPVHRLAAAKNSLIQRSWAGSGDSQS
jgi:acyl-lipid omega-6 desaturase (Delta-12 desaturase)